MAEKKKDLIEDSIVDLLAFGINLKRRFKMKKGYFDLLRLIIVIAVIVGVYIVSKSIFILAMIIIIEAVSCFLLDEVHVKSWLEILSFATIICSIKYGFIQGFWFFIIAYICSMIARFNIYPDEIPGLFVRGFILSFFPSILADMNIFVISFVTMLIHSIGTSALYLLFGKEPTKAIFDSVLGTIVTIILCAQFVGILG